MGNRTTGGGGDGGFGVVCTREAYRQFSLAQTVIRQYSVLAIFLAKCSLRNPPATQRPKARKDWDRNSLKG